MAKRIIPRAMFQPLDGLTADQLYDNKPLVNLVRNEVYPAIEEAFQNKKTFATIFEVNSTGYFIDIPKQYWVAALEECIKFNLEEEKFEDCVRIKELIDRIKKPTRTINKKTTDGEGANRDTAGNKLNA